MTKKGELDRTAILTLFYVHDPMCSWCWAFRPIWEKIRSSLPDAIVVRYLLGGLAADTTEPMPDEMQARIQRIWHMIEVRVPGTRFNFDFWHRCRPRRATYPACRAVIAARNQGTRFEEPMILAIQQAYYLRAMNPSDDDTLTTLAAELGLDAELFGRELNAPQTQRRLAEEIRFSRKIGGDSFPSLILKQNGEFRSLALDYNDAEVVLRQLRC